MAVLVIMLKLLRSDNSKIVCSPHQNSDWLAATIGGLGLTGLILQAKIKLNPIIATGMQQINHSFNNLDECFDLFDKYNTTYKVAWLDLNYKSKNYSRGILTFAEHSEQNAKYKSHKINIPYNLPSWLLNTMSINWFNQRHYDKQLKQPTHVHYNDYFFPLDHIHNWNRIYGKAGFIQYQCSLPKAGCIDFINQIQQLELPVFLTTIKYLGNKNSRGLISFADKNYTIAIDTPFRGAKTLQLLNQLDTTVLQYCGKIYPAKDARMSGDMFKLMYPQWKAFSDYIDPNFSHCTCCSKRFATDWFTFCISR